MPQSTRKHNSMTTKQIIILLVLSLLSVFLIVITGSLYLGVNLPSLIFPSTNTPLPTHAPLNVNINLLVDLATDAGKPIVTGKTNLPSGTIIMITVRGENNLFVGQDRVYVTNGTFSSVPFSLPSSPFDIDEYTVEALMPELN